MHADRHHRAAVLYEEVAIPRSLDAGEGWRLWLERVVPASALGPARQSAGLRDGAAAGFLDERSTR